MKQNYIFIYFIILFANLTVQAAEFGQRDIPLAERRLNDDKLCRAMSFTRDIYAKSNFDYNYIFKDRIQRCLLNSFMVNPEGIEAIDLGNNQKCRVSRTNSLDSHVKYRDKIEYRGYNDKDEYYLFRKVNDAYEEYEDWQKGDDKISKDEESTLHKFCRDNYKERLNDSVLLMNKRLANKDKIAKQDAKNTVDTEIKKHFIDTKSPQDVLSIMNAPTAKSSWLEENIDGSVSVDWTKIRVCYTHEIPKTLVNEFIIKNGGEVRASISLVDRKRWNKLIAENQRYKSDRDRNKNAAQVLENGFWKSVAQYDSDKVNWFDEIRMISQFYQSVYSNGTNKEQVLIGQKLVSPYGRCDLLLTTADMFSVMFLSELSLDLNNYIKKMNLKTYFGSGSSRVYFENDYQKVMGAATLYYKLANLEKPNYKYSGPYHIETVFSGAELAKHKQSVSDSLKIKAEQAQSMLTAQKGYFMLLLENEGKGTGKACYPAYADKDIGSFVSYTYANQWITNDHTLANINKVYQQIIKNNGCKIVFSNAKDTKILMAALDKKSIKHQLLNQWVSDKDYAFFGERVKQARKNNELNRIKRKAYICSTYINDLKNMCNSVGGQSCEIYRQQLKQCK